jgi:hypothetical protein
MPIQELLAEAFGGILRVAGRILFELLFELILGGTGQVLIRLARPRSVPGGATCVLVGLLFWIAAGVAGSFLYLAITA